MKYIKLICTWLDGRNSSFFAFVFSIAGWVHDQPVLTIFFAGVMLICGAVESLNGNQGEAS